MPFIYTCVVKKEISKPNYEVDHVCSNMQRAIEDNYIMIYENGFFFGKTKAKMRLKYCPFCKGDISVAGVKKY